MITHELIQQSWHEFTNTIKTFSSQNRICILVKKQLNYQYNAVGCL